jgi:hypothetical protein
MKAQDPISNTEEVSITRFCFLYQLYADCAIYLKNISISEFHILID